MKRLFQITAFTALAILAAGASHAQPIDHFDIGPGGYTVGNLVGQGPAVTGWGGSWTSQCCTAATQQVIASGLSYLTVPVSGGAIQSNPDFAAFGRATRPFSAIDDNTVGTFYMSFMMQGDPTAAPITYSTLELHNLDGTGDGNRSVQVGVGENIGLGQSPNYFVRLFNTNNDPARAMDLGTNDGLVHFFVMKFQQSSTANADIFTLYHNPTDLTVETNNSAAFTATGFNMTLGSNALATFGGTTLYTFDELRRGSTFQSVTSPVPEFTPGDTSGNGTVELADFNPIRANWLETNATFGSLLERDDGDLNLDGVVGLQDFREWKNAFNSSASVVASAFASLNPVPEPSGLLLTILAALGMSIGSSRHRS